MSTEASSSSALHVFKSENEWVIALSVEDAIAWALSTFGPDKGDGWSEPDYWKRAADDEEITIREESGERTTKTAADWARAEGRGLLCAWES